MEQKKIKFPVAAVLWIIVSAWNLINNFSVLASGYGGAIVSVFFNVVWIAFSVIILMKKRDIVALGSMAFVTLMELVFYGFNFSFLAMLALTAMAVVTYEQNLIKIDTEKLKEIAKKLFFVPAVLFAIYEVIWWIRTFSLGYHSLSFISVVMNILGVVAFLLMGMWIVNPYEDEKMVVNNGVQNTSSNAECCEAEGYVKLLNHVLLLLFTCGVWAIIWVYRTTKFLNNAPDVEQYNPTTKLLLCLFVPFYQLYWLYKHGQRIDKLSGSKGIASSGTDTLCLILGIFIPLVAYIIMQDRINAICVSKK